MWALIAILSLAALAILVLSIPLEMKLRANVKGRPAFNMRFSWFFGLLNKEIPGAHPEKAKVKKKKEKKPGEKGKRPDIRFIFKIVRTKGLFKQSLSLVKYFFRSFRFSDFTADFTIGLGDPADTGLLFSFISPAVTVFNPSRYMKLYVRPSFSDQPVVEGYSEGTVSLRPVNLVPPLVKFIFSIPTARIIKALIVHKWKRRR